MRKVEEKTKAKGERQRERPKPQEVGPDIKANISGKNEGIIQTKSGVKEFSCLFYFAIFYHFFPKRNGVRVLIHYSWDQQSFQCSVIFFKSIRQLRGVSRETLNRSDSE